MASLYANSKNTLVNGLDKFSDPNYVSIFDTMLRDGEQAPASSEIEFELVKCIAHEIGNSIDEDSMEEFRVLERFGEDSRILEKNSLKSLEISRLVQNSKRGATSTYIGTCV
ncbi:hypothetical protein MTR67_034132 [Solanum verrucosum]|uniref:Uncharacterized protein n=1 Tax=Solanum verrucosum TaxID=315347 RepID=A0AAF0U7J6_SOLVR|nr:hypothetical protein MTR67_034132 [Solanum verrucosum]